MKRVYLLLLTTAIFSCSQHSTTAEIPDKQFDAYKEAFILRLWKMNPGWASSVGYHAYDSVLIVPTAQRELEERNFLTHELRLLSKFDTSGLSASNQIDFQLIRNHLNSSLWELNDFRSGEWNPSNYNVCGGFAEMLANDYAPLDERLHNFGIRLKNVPVYYAAAKSHINSPTVEHTQLAIDQNLGGITTFTDQLAEALEKSGLNTAEQDTIRKRAGAAVAAVHDYVTFLRGLKNPNPTSFRIGSDKYAKKFAFDIQSDFTPKQIYHRALNHKNELHGKMLSLAKQLWPKYLAGISMPDDEHKLVRMVIDRLSEKHVRPQDFQREIERQIPTLEKFVREKNLIYLDPKKPLVVRKEPDYMAGVAGASISAPGPYDKNGNTYYNVGSLSGWSAAQSESYLREYNDYVLQILNIHEAVPGHYTQLIYSNNSPSIIKSIFGNGAMVEGWAVYSELMMLENGYGAESGKASASPEMWLMYYKWNLRTTCNTILDYSVHNLNMSKEQAMNLLINEAYQQQAEAEGKWKRATLTQVQLCSYFTGFSEIVELRKAVQSSRGKDFQLKKFHEEFLGFGSAPVRSIRKLMLGR